jgi:alpha-glucosidase
VWLADSERLALYLRDDELHSAFNFDFLCSAFEAPALRRVIDSTLASHAGLGATPTWVLSNHDVVRHVTRYGRANTLFRMNDRRIGEASDLELGTRRARAAALLALSLPGTVYIYQGDELGLWEVEDIPDELLQDPFWQRSRQTDRGRDGCRVPLPWSGEQPPFGFTADGARPWLPQPEGWKTLTAEAQLSDPGSMLALYKRALALRRAEPSLSSADLVWNEGPADILSYWRGADVLVLANLADEPVDLPRHDYVLLASGPLADSPRRRRPRSSETSDNDGPDGDLVPPDTTVWMRAERSVNVGPAT